MDWKTRFFGRATETARKPGTPPGAAEDAGVRTDARSDEPPSVDELSFPEEGPALPPNTRSIIGASYGEFPENVEPPDDPPGSLKGRALKLLRDASGLDLRDDYLWQTQILESTARKLGEIPLPEGASELVYEGAVLGADGTFEMRAIEKLAPLEPAAKTSDELLVVVNGMGAGVEKHRASMQEVADASGCAVIGIHNATGGLAVDMLEAAATLLGMDSRAVASTAAFVLDLLEAQKPFVLVGHSQGGLIVSHALTRAHKELCARGMTAAEATRALSRVQVETHGATGFRYPDGPQYVHYHNTKDPVPSTYNRDEQLATPMKAMQLLVHTKKRTNNDKLGKGAVVVTFSDAADGSKLGPHLLHNYLAHRVPFAIARERNST